MTIAEVSGAPIRLELVNYLLVYGSSSHGLIQRLSRTAANNEKPIKKKKEKPVKVKDQTHVVDTPEKPSEEELNPFLIFPSPEENYKEAMIEKSAQVSLISDGTSPTGNDVEIVHNQLGIRKGYPRGFGHGFVVTGHQCASSSYEETSR